MLLFKTYLIWHLRRRDIWWPIPVYWEIVLYHWCEPQQIQGVFLLLFGLLPFDPLLISCMSFLPKPLLYFLQSRQDFSSTISESLLTIYIFITLNSMFLTQISILVSRITHSTLYSIAPIVSLIGNPDIIHPNLTHNMLFHLNDPHHSPSYLSNKLWHDPWILHFPYFWHPVNHQAGPCNPRFCPSSN